MMGISPSPQPSPSGRGGTCRAKVNALRERWLSSPECSLRGVSKPQPTSGDAHLHCTKRSAVQVSRVAPVRWADVDIVPERSERDAVRAG